MSETLESPKPKTETHKTMGGKVNIYRRENSDNWQCSTFLNGRNWRVSTHEDSLGRAKDFAEDWYLALRGKAHAGLLVKETRRQGKKFKQAAEKFLEEAPILTQGQRGPTWLEQYELKLNGVILPFLGEKYLGEITSGLIQDYRVWRAQNCKTGGTPARSTVHKEIVCIRQVLKTAKRHGWMEYLPDMSVPDKALGKITHRHGSRRRNIRSSIRQRAGARMSPSRSASNGNANNCTIMFFSPSTPAFGPMRRG